MTIAFAGLSDTDLRELTSAIKAGRVTGPYTALQLSRVTSPGIAQGVADSLQQLASLGFDERQVATTLEVVLSDRVNGRKNEQSIDLVTSGPEAPGIANRDTAVVVRELFAHAQQSVLVIGYSVYQGANVFESLATRMEAVPQLDVEMFLNIARPDNDTTQAEILVSRYAQRFRDGQWPKGARIPEVYYDPRSVALDKKSSLHAKCIVVDSLHVFVSSANFTEAGQQRNIEVGLRIESRWLAQRLTRHFQLLKEHGIVARAF